MMRILAPRVLALMMRVLAPCVLALMIVRGRVCAYNLDVANAVVYRMDRDSMFGFSVTGYRDQHGSWIIVGAPNAQTRQSGVNRAGAAYRCSTELALTAFDAGRTCQQIAFDPNGEKVSRGRKLEIKAGQWLGASVTSTVRDNSSGVVVACAPRYVSLAASKLNTARHDPVGTCFMATDNFQRVNEFSPCRNVKRWGHHRQGSCEAGLGLALSNDGDRLYIGAVGSRYGHGRLFGLPVGQGQKLPPIEYFRSSRIGQLFSQSLYTRPENHATSLGPSSDDDIYLGFAVAVGEFTGDDQQDVAVAAPRADGLTGKVLVYDSDLNNRHNISGGQIGSYFGYSLCAADVNGDGLEDIIIGEPLHTDFSNTEGMYDTGRVVVAYQDSKHAFVRFEVIDGKLSRGRFGTAVTSLGDVDLDGFDDIAVGAPHDAMSELGTVFIFHGSANGIRKKPTQIIRAPDVASNLVSFGYSLHGGVDLDSNRYADLIVGSYASDSTVYFRARPVVHVEASIEYLGSPYAIDLEGGGDRCVLSNGRSVPCLSAHFCMQYTGVGVDKHVEFQVEFHLDARRPKAPRMFFRHWLDSHSENHTVRAVKGQQWCLRSPLEVYVDQDRLRDKLTPLVMEARYSLVYRRPSLGAEERWSLRPILNLGAEPTVFASVSIFKNCGLDQRCVPDLRLQVRPKQTTYLFGSRERLSIESSIVNIREDAYETMFHMTLPRGVDYIGAEKANDSASLPVLCTLRSEESDTLLCDLGNPMPASSLVHFFIHLMPHSTIDEAKARYEFKVTVNSTNPEELSTEHDNFALISVPIKVNAKLLAFGSSLPEVITFNKSEYLLEDRYMEEQVGPEVSHVYQLSNSGPSDILVAEVYIMWPTYTLEGGKHLLYMLEQPELEGPIRCDPVLTVNPESLKINRSRDNLLAVAEAAGLHQRRLRRESDAFLASRSCGQTRCSRIHCDVGPLQGGGSAVVRVRARVWVSTVLEEIDKRFPASVSISSTLSARVLELPYQVDPTYMQHTFLKVTTTVQTDEVVSKPVPWWIIVLATCGGVSILVIIILALYKMGFFERHRRPTRR